VVRCAPTRFVALARRLYRQVAPTVFAIWTPSGSAILLRSEDQT
jgi:hypothetical protein